MPMVVDPAQIELSRDLRELCAAYNDIEDLVSIGAYKRGTRPATDRALERHEPIIRFLKQRKDETSQWSQTMTALKTALSD